MASGNRRIRAALMVAVLGLTGYGGWFVHARTHPPSPAGQIVQINWGQAMLQQEVLRDAHRLQDIAREAVRGNYDQTTITELKAMSETLKDHQGEIPCMEIVHRNIEIVERMWHEHEGFREPRQDPLAPALDREGHPLTAKYLKATGELTVSSLKAVCGQ